MRDTRFVFVEGIMGAGKTTTAWWLARQISRRGIEARFVLEGPTKREPRHPLRVATDLPHPSAVWQDVTADEFVALSLRKWRAYTEEARKGKVVTVCDGLLFHGNMTDFMLIDPDAGLLHEYVMQVLGCLEILRPTVVYLRRTNIGEALRTICTERGTAWEERQIRWKVGSPYGQHRGLEGFDGLVQLYRDYCGTCEDILAQLPVAKLVIENVGGWAAYRRDIAAFLDLPKPWWERVFSR